jgi:hypothetical protein
VWQHACEAAVTAALVAAPACVAGCIDEIRAATSGGCFLHSVHRCDLDTGDKQEPYTSQ